MLIPAGKECATCSNRERKVVQYVRRSKSQDSPAQPKGTDILGEPLDPDHSVPLLTTPLPAPAGEYDPGLPTPEEACALRVGTLGHVPKSLRADWGSLYLGLLSDFLRTRSKRDFQLLWMAPKCLLGPLKRGGRRNGRMLGSTLRRRFQQWHACQYPELWAEATRATPAAGKQFPPKGAPSEEEEDEGELHPDLTRRVIEAASEGALSKACAMLLDEQKLAELTPSTLDELRKLHPDGVPPEVAQSFVDPFQEGELSAKHVWKGLKRFKRLSAPGPSGLRVAHLCEALDTAVRQDRVDLLKHLAAWVTVCARGQLPVWSAPHICAARLVPFSKKTGGIRPVAVGEVLRRLCGKILLGIHAPGLLSALAPFRWGWASREPRKP